MSDDQETPKVEDPAPQAQAPAAQDAPEPESAPEQVEQAEQTPDAPPAAEAADKAAEEAAGKAADKAGGEDKAPKPSSRAAPRCRQGSITSGAPGGGRRP